MLPFSVASRLVTGPTQPSYPVDAMGSYSLTGSYVSPPLEDKAEILQELHFNVKPVNLTPSYHILWNGTHGAMGQVTCGAPLAQNRVLTCHHSCNRHLVRHHHQAMNVPCTSCMGFLVGQLRGCTALQLLLHLCNMNM
jgi:hypothetical protein